MASQPGSGRGGHCRSRLGDRRLASLAVIVLLMAACGSSTPASASLVASSPARPGASASLSPAATPTATPDQDAVFASIESTVQQLRGLTQRSPVGRSILNEDQLKSVILTSFDKSNPAALVAANEKLEKGLGLLPPDASLKDLDVQLLSSQVAGLYDPDTKTMDVISKNGQLGPVEQITYAHEFDHALQDQNFGLKKLGLDDTSNSDRSLARLSLPEGDATLLMTLWAETSLTPAQLLQLAQEANDPTQTAILKAMPEDLKQTLLFPYEQGLAWVSGLHADGGWAAVNAAYARPPDSTEQILHAAKWASHEPPISVTIPADLPTRLGTGWVMPLTDTLGELQLRIWLEQVGKLPVAQAEAAAAGWGGDQVALVQKGSTFGIAIITKWDTAADATEFAAAAGPTLKLLPSSTAMIDPGSTSQVVLFIASDQATINVLAGALGLAG
jgi:hypothetical protein